MKPIHVQLNKLSLYLSDEAIDIPMSEIVGQDHRLEQIGVLDDELFSAWEPLNDLGVLIILNKKKYYANDFKALLYEVRNGRLGLFHDFMLCYVNSCGIYIFYILKL